jgi:hypothetical protein
MSRNRGKTSWTHTSGRWGLWTGSLRLSEGWQRVSCGDQSQSPDDRAGRVRRECDSRRHCASTRRRRRHTWLPLSTVLRMRSLARYQNYRAGPGLWNPGGVLPKIFDPYFTTKATGSDLGLAIAYAIVAKHAGSITMQAPGTQSILRARSNTSGRTSRRPRRITSASTSTRAWRNWSVASW